MPAIDRRQGLWMLGAGVATATAIGLGAVARAAVPAGPATLALVEKNAGRVAFYALPGGRRLGSIALGAQPHEIAADAAGRFAYVGHYGVAGWKAPGAGGDKVWVIDLQKRVLARTIDLAPYGRLHAVRIDAAGRLYVLSEKDSLLARFDDPARDDAPARLIPVTGARSHYMMVRRDGARAYVADTMSGAVIMVDPEDMGTPPVRRRIGTAPEGLTLSRDQRTLYVIDRPAGTLHALDAATLQERTARPMRGEAVRIVTLPDDRLIVSNSADQSLSRLNPVTLEEEDRFALPAAAPGLNLAGETIYASLQDDRVIVIDARSWQAIDRFATGAGPDAGVVFPSSRD
jgi:DNA-binding beta-propeller fold protein YncE